MPRFPSAQGRLNHEPDSTLAVTKTCPKDGVHLWLPSCPRNRVRYTDTYERQNKDILETLRVE